MKRVNLGEGEWGWQQPKPTQLCNNCHKPGHYWAECFEPKKCGRCGSYDHVATYCPFKDEKCEICQKVGHQKSMCWKGVNGKVKKLRKDGGTLVELEYSGNGEEEEEEEVPSFPPKVPHVPSFPPPPDLKPLWRSPCAPQADVKGKGKAKGEGMGERPPPLLQGGPFSNCDICGGLAHGAAECPSAKYLDKNVQKGGPFDSAQNIVAQALWGANPGFSGPAKGGPCAGDMGGPINYTPVPVVAPNSGYAVYDHMGKGAMAFTDASGSARVGVPLQPQPFQQPGQYDFGGKGPMQFQGGNQWYPNGTFDQQPFDPFFNSGGGKPGFKPA